MKNKRLLTTRSSHTKYNKKRFKRTTIYILLISSVFSTCTILLLLHFQSILPTKKSNQSSPTTFTNNTNNTPPPNSDHFFIHVSTNEPIKDIQQKDLFSHIPITIQFNHNDILFNKLKPLNTKQKLIPLLTQYFDASSKFEKQMRDLDVATIESTNQRTPINTLYNFIDFVTFIKNTLKVIEEINALNYEDKIFNYIVMKYILVHFRECVNTMHLVDSFLYKPTTELLQNQMFEERKWRLISLLFKKVYGIIFECVEEEEDLISLGVWYTLKNLKDEEIYVWTVKDIGKIKYFVYLESLYMCSVLYLNKKKRETDYGINFVDIDDLEYVEGKDEKDKEEILKRIFANNLELIGLWFRKSGEYDMEAIGLKYISLLDNVMELGSILNNRGNIKNI
eukprot:GAHX01003377.1.p1 GENE.GAHX01003377.1~~GAHX01003377.1.p1  ORF type:complete len:394 (+),score=69.76 GAHX01003377.1:1659-2840(+)